MAVPDYQSLMLPLLRHTSTAHETSTSEAVDVLARELDLTDADVGEMLPSGTQSTFTNRVGWAATYMKKAGLLKSTRRGHYCITERGRELLRSKPSSIDVKLLKQYPEFIAFQNLRGTRSGKPPGNDVSNAIEAPEVTPLEALESAYENLHAELADDLLSRLKTGSPSFFERVVVELLVKMGYGGSRADAGRAIGRSGDEGIDGIIKEDKLGLDVVYIQAKRWDSNAVGGPALMQFAGALAGQKASKGIYITTSTFTDAARRYVANIGVKIVLIDGVELTNLMIEHDVGVSTLATYPVKRVDNDYFDESV